MRRRGIVLAVVTVALLVTAVLFTQSPAPAVEKTFGQNVRQVVEAAFTLPLEGMEADPKLPEELQSIPTREWLEGLADAFAGEQALDAFCANMIYENSHLWGALGALAAQGPVTVSDVALEPTVKDSAAVTFTVRYTLDGAPGQGTLAGRAQHDGTGALVFMALDPRGTDAFVAALGDGFAKYRMAQKPY